MTTKQSSQLVAKINKHFAIGDKMKVKLDDGSFAEWTVKYPSEILNGTPVVWPVEHRSCYLASRVKF